MHNRSMRRMLCLSLLLVATTAYAHPPKSTPASCDAAVATAQAAARLPDNLLHAIALVESGRPDPRTGEVTPWPWTINVGGQGYFFATKAAAILAVQDLQEAGINSIDVGCMQINLMFHPAAFVNLQQAFDPAANARYAARFLTLLYDRSQDWTKAVGDYHSQTPTLAGPYQRRVLANWMPPPGTAKRYAAMVSWEDVYRVPRSWEEVYAAQSRGR